MVQRTAADSSGGVLRFRSAGQSVFARLVIVGQLLMPTPPNPEFIRDPCPLSQEDKCRRALDCHDAIASGAKLIGAG